MPILVLLLNLNSQGFLRQNNIKSPSFKPASPDQSQSWAVASALPCFRLFALSRPPFFNCGMTFFVLSDCHSPFQWFHHCWRHEPIPCSQQHPGSVPRGPRPDPLCARFRASHCRCIFASPILPVLVHLTALQGEAPSWGRHASESRYNFKLKKCKMPSKLNHH
jgi:hypothetical protein